jgi:hypothetical protein
LKPRAGSKLEKRMPGAVINSGLLSFSIGTASSAPLSGSTLWGRSTVGAGAAFAGAAIAGAEEESVVLFSHIPMHPSPGGFDLEKNARMQALIQPYGDRVWADLAGHYHVTADEAEEAGYHLYVTDAVWDDSLDIRLVDASFDGQKWSFVTEVTTVPFP